MDPLLTVLVPVYNGGEYLKPLLDRWVWYCQQKEAEFFVSKVEFVISNNRSTDDTLSVANSFRSLLPNFRVVDHSDHVPTAEQSFFRSFKDARGEYTWVLGADDSPVFESLPQLLEVLGNGVFDFVQSNYAVSSDVKYPARSSILLAVAQVTPIDLVQATQRFGYFYLMAGISGQIVRTSAVRDYDLDAIISVSSPIYSHVAAYLDIFHGRPAALLNRPLVVYRANYTDAEEVHWKRVAAKLGVADCYFWTISFVRQLRYLERQGAIPYTFLAEMVDNNNDGIFRPPVLIYLKLVEQLDTMRRNPQDQRNRLPYADFSEVADFVVNQQPYWRVPFAVLRKALGLLTAGESIPDHLWNEVLQHRDRTYRDFPFAGMIKGNIGGYEVYRIAGIYYAVEVRRRDVLLDRVLHLTDNALPPFVLTGNTWDELVAQVIECKSGQHEVDEVNVALLHRLDDVIGRLSQATADARHLYGELLIMRTSVSWRITAPLRAVARKVRRIAGRFS